MIVNREQLLNELEAVKPGLSEREVIEQSMCYVFKDGLVMTFNEEIACWHKSCLKPMVGAVPAKPLRELLHKMKEEEIEVGTNNNQEFIISGKKKRASIRMEEEVLLEIDDIEKPKKWRDLPDGFMEAIGIVKHCAGNDETQFATTCVHIHPKWIETSDNVQAARYTVATGVEESLLIRRESISEIEQAGMEQISETKTWVHFRNSDKLVISCRKWVSDFPDITPVLKVKGEEVVLPKMMKDATERATIFSKENAYTEDVTILLKGNKLQIKGEGATGKYVENKKVQYSGPPIKFTVAPKLLVTLVQRQDKCTITKDRLKARLGKFTYVTALGDPDED